jgi:hypothetical protein
MKRRSKKQDKQDIALNSSDQAKLVDCLIEEMREILKKENLVDVEWNYGPQEKRNKQ